MLSKIACIYSIVIACLLLQKIIAAMHWIGACKMTLFLSVWMLGCFIVPVSLVCVAYGIWWPSYVLLAYVSFTYFFPPQRYDFMRSFLCIEKTPYFKKQEIIFEEGAKPPVPMQKVMLAVFPHGILTMGWSMLNTSTCLRDCEVVFLISSVLRNYLPFVRDFMASGNTEACDAETMDRLMSEGNNVAILPGGFQEATIYRRGKHQLFINSKKGFIKYALKYGYDITPIYVFGEENTFWTYEAFPSLMLYLNKFQIPGCFFIGTCFFMPDPSAEFTIVIGKNIVLPKLDHPPTFDEVNESHRVYVDALKGIFERNKEKYAMEGKAAVLHIR